MSYTEHTAIDECLCMVNKAVNAVQCCSPYARRIAQDALGRYEMPGRVQCHVDPFDDVWHKSKSTLVYKPLNGMLFAVAKLCHNITRHVPMNMRHCRLMLSLPPP